MCYRTEFGQDKRYEQTCGNTPEQWDSRVPPFKVTQGHRNRYGSIGYL